MVGAECEDTVGNWWLRAGIGSFLGLVGWGSSFQLYTSSLLSLAPMAMIT